MLIFLPFAAWRLFWLLFTILGNFLKTSGHPQNHLPKNFAIKLSFFTSISEK
jgi:hypothetical protein